MAQVTPADIPLPAFLDPLLDYLSDTLPRPVYSFIISFASHFLAFISASLTLFGALLQTDPSQWSVQTILPPLIAFLTAYFALVSIYRTTSWMVRTSFWFIKWGTILGVLAGGAGWMMGRGNAVGAPGVASVLGGLILDMVNGEGSAGGNARSRGRSGGNAQRKPRPKPWDSFQAHQEWQYEEGSASQGGDAQAVIDDILTAARDSGVWNAMKEALKTFGGQRETDRDQRESRGSTSR
ncbi:hypothetical protein V5O48_000203 [Marasmius crinis-equi]|uniref:Uncharacterized protein n=1 Tax=Marasmius crinis-equi TaxID=585013 RepID=A0ABR3G2M1_9AGAR